MKGHTLRGPCGCSDEEGAKILMETFSRIVGEDEMKTRYHRGVELSASRTESMISTVVKSEDGNCRRQRGNISAILILFYYV